MILQNDDVMAFVATTQPDKARAFYCGVLGLRFEEDTPFALVMRAANATVRIQKVQAFTPLPFTVMGWKVANLAAVAAQLKDRGVRRGAVLRAWPKTNWASGRRPAAQRSAGSRTPTATSSR
jgi:catechol 2,3-dioxygenase-like lactoylglutathione lyase family enzyme